MPSRMIGDRPLTVAERKARSRAHKIGTALGHLQIAQELVKVLQYEIDRPELIDRLEDLEIHLQLVRDHIPQ